jgi:hypothetical protein
MADLLARLRSEVEKGMNTLTVKSKEVIDAARIKSQISNAEQEKQDALIEIGTSVCGMLDNDNFNKNVIRAKCAAIRQWDDSIKQLEGELALVHSQAHSALAPATRDITCSCGSAMADGSRFCSSCGNSIDVQPSKTRPN